MMLFRRFAAMLIALVAATVAPAQAPPKPLFASDQPLRLTIRGPITRIAQTAPSRQPRDAVLTVSGAVAETHPIQLTPRGITRLKRDVCQFPPLRVRFHTIPGPGSPFAGQRQLKLVTHCQAHASFQKHLLLEYAAYRLYNQLTPASFRARLATIDYVNDDGRPVATRLGFFIEEIEDVAARNAMRRGVTGDRVPLPQVSATDGARVALFEYMIGNQDFSIRAGPPGEGCCHNSRLIGPSAAGTLVPVPYDFDFSGLVDAPYAAPPDGDGSVLDRRYQGFCAHNPQAVAMAPLFRSQRGALLAALGQVPLDEPVRRRAAAYIDGFFADIADDRRMAAKLFRTCLK
jgi:hypothetical protein